MLSAIAYPTAFFVQQPGTVARYTNPSQVRIQVDVVWEDADPVDSLIDRVAAARALAPRDVGLALDLIAYGEYGIALELVCTQIDEHDSLGCRACLGQL